MSESSKEKTHVSYTLCFLAALVIVLAAQPDETRELLSEARDGVQRLLNVVILTENGTIPKQPFE